MHDLHRPLELVPGKHHTILQHVHYNPELLNVKTNTSYKISLLFRHDYGLSFGLEIISLVQFYGEMDLSVPGLHLLLSTCSCTNILE